MLSSEVSYTAWDPRRLPVLLRMSYTAFSTAGKTVPSSVMEDGARTGVEHFTMRQRVVPYLRLVQAGTPYGKRSHPQYVEGCVEGDIIDTLMKKPMKQAIVIPCKYEDQWTEWEAKTLKEEM